MISVRQSMDDLAVQYEDVHGQTNIPNLIFTFHIKYILPNILIAFRNINQQTD